MELLIDADENNYSLLREKQRKGDNRIRKQQSSTSLAQNDQSAVENVINENAGQGGTHVHVNQLVSEVAESSIDNRDDL